MKGLPKFLFGLITFFSILSLSLAIDTISVNQTIRDGETIVSAGGRFELGFFRPSNSSQNRFLGIWYKKISSGNDAVVWVANRLTPLTDAFGILRLNGNGILQIINSSNSVIWSSNSSRSTSQSLAMLLDSGNFVIREDSSSASSGNFIWQSFDYPGDTLLPGVKFGKDLVTGIERYHISWKSEDDPSPGEYSIYYDMNGYPQVFQKKGADIQYRLGGWNGLRFTGLASLKPNPIFTYEFVFNQKEIYYKWELINSSASVKTRFNSNGEMQRFNWNERTHEWFMYSSTTTDACTRYALCGPYGSCNIDNSPSCGCLKGFEPKNQEEWNRADWSGGCKRRVALDCGSGEGFRKYFNVKQPDTRQSWFNWTMTLTECENMCKENCTCSAYSNLNISGSGSGCLLWFGDLIDIRQFSEDGQEIYIRMAASELVKHGSSNSKSRVIAIVISVLLLLITGAGLCLLHLKKRRKLKRKENMGEVIKQEYNNGNENKNMNMSLLSLSTLLQATDNFSIYQKLGEGGFGSVYKGRLLTGQEIAVKRLAKHSSQGLQEFKNEIRLISNLQHRNLVKIIGCCLEGEERMLAYEYLPNKSLDSFLFDNEKRILLTWQHRIDIAIGIAKGLLYLHCDSRLKIIHRDLKASNVLLDNKLNPKISDFGIARIFGGDQIEGRTKHVIGTYGYMSPEYAIQGKFSVKSDVFSFGVLLLELVTGKKNTKYHHPNHHHSLLGHAWLLWNEGKALELVDACLEDSWVEPQVIRFIQVGLLCIQKFPKDRPTMSWVVTMLGNEDAILPQPKEPGFYMESDNSDAPISIDEGSGLSECALTITVLESR